MAERRAGQYPPTWETRRAAPLPATCAPGSTPGLYIPATAAGAPNVTSSCQIEVNFNVNASTYFGENIYILGSADELGGNDINNAYPLGAGGYTSERPLWAASIFLNAGQSITYKYARQQNCDRPFIVESASRTLVVPACGGHPISTDDAYNGPVGTPGPC